MLSELKEAPARRGAQRKKGGKQKGALFLRSRCLSELAEKLPEAAGSGLSAMMITHRGRFAKQVVLLCAEELSQWIGNKTRPSCLAA